MKNNLEAMQNLLDKLYANELDKSKLKKIFSEEEMKKISAPHLLNIDQSYIEAKVKILFIGKETNLWWGKLKDFVSTTNAIEILKQRYRAKFFGGEVPRSKDISTFKVYQAENYNTPFFTEYKKINTTLLNGITGSLVWANLLKMDLDSGKGYSKNSKENKDIVAMSKIIFLTELEILEPDYIIFATSYTYDKIIKEFLNDKISNSDVIESKSLWRFNIGKTICFRTWHPSTIKYKALKSKLEYYKDIITYIQHDIESKDE